MSDPAAYLTARLNEVEAVAKAADINHDTTGDSWHTRDCGYAQIELLDPCTCDVPDGVLRLVAATRKLLHELQEASDRCEEGDGHGEMGEFIGLDKAVEIVATGWGWEEQG